MTAPGTDYLLRRGVAEIIVEQELTKLLESDRPLRLKQGFDPSLPDIHLGHVVGLRKLRQFQELGHQVILIVGDWTARIGDPSGESATRPMLTAEEVRRNAQTYMDQFFKVVDRQKTQVRWQSEWFGKFGLSDVIELTSKFTVAQFLARDDFSKRYNAGRPIAITELLYPLLQAYDSVAIEADMEFGGIDQKFNCLVGRELQATAGQRPQQVFLVPLLVGTDGSQKMSKSLDNYVAIDEPPNEIYGKVMSIPDSLIMPYFELVTDVPDNELEEMRQQLDSQSVNPMSLKKRLAGEIVAQFHGGEAAREAEQHFTRVVQKKELPEEMQEYRLPIRPVLTGVFLKEVALGKGHTEALVSAEKKAKEIMQSSHHLRLAGVSVEVVDLLIATSLAKSRSEAKRLLTQGAIELDGHKVSNNMVAVQEGSILKVGKRRFVKLVNR